MAKIALSNEGIRELLPHRYPMLMIDRVLEMDSQLVIAEKLVSANEPYFAGHFPDRPIMPGVLILEGLAQTAGVGIVYHNPMSRSLGVALVGVNRARFRKPVVPGDTLTLASRIVRRRGRLYVADCVARVDGEAVAEAELLASFVEWEEPS